jgi:hypothetical protein
MPVRPEQSAAQNAFTPLDLPLEIWLSFIGITTVSKLCALNPGR